VTHPSQKVVVDCEAISDRKQISGVSVVGQAHGCQAATFLFVDGHARFLHRREQLIDPRKAGPGWDWSGLDWIDFP
jgi:prepilin-type processing-associated H-X9-DG protein